MATVAWVLAHDAMKRSQTPLSDVEATLRMNANIAYECVSRGWCW